MEKTREEIEHLKHNWLCDPCWGIEDTKGFEGHKEELKAYRLKIEDESKQIEARRVFDKKEKIGLLFSHKVEQDKLFVYLENLEFKIKELQKQVDILNGDLR